MKMTEKKLDGFLIEQKDLERLLTAKDLSFAEVCNLLSIMEKNYPRCYRRMISMLQSHLSYRMKFGDLE